MPIYNTAEKLKQHQLMARTGLDWPLKRDHADDADLSAGCISTLLYRGSGGSREEVEGVATPSSIQKFMDTPLLQDRALLIMTE